MMYAAAPLGATVAALTGGWLGGFARSGALLLASGAAAFVALGSLGFISDPVVAFVALAGFGYLSSIASLLQFTLVQRHTPEHLLGRVNGLWAAQAVTGDAFGALALGGLTRVVSADVSGSHFQPRRASFERRDGDRISFASFRLVKEKRGFPFDRRRQERTAAASTLEEREGLMCGPRM